MELKTYGDIFDLNQKIHQKFDAALSEIGDEQASRAIEGEKWSIAQVVEHVSIVEQGTAQICASLLARAEAGGQTSDGTLNIAPEFFTKTAAVADVKLEAPKRVEPVAGRPIEEALAKLKESGEMLESLRASFEKFDGTIHKFPHPYFGDLSAAEWLLLTGGHKTRHLRQIKAMLARM